MYRDAEDKSLVELEYNDCSSPYHVKFQDSEGNEITISVKGSSDLFFYLVSALKVVLTLLKYKHKVIVLSHPEYENTLESLKNSQEKLRKIRRFLPWL